MDTNAWAQKIAEMQHAMLEEGKLESTMDEIFNVEKMNELMQPQQQNVNPHEFKKMLMQVSKAMLEVDPMVMANMVTSLTNRSADAPAPDMQALASQLSQHIPQHVLDSVEQTLPTVFTENTSTGATQMASTLASEVQAEANEEDVAQVVGTFFNIVEAAEIQAENTDNAD